MGEAMPANRHGIGGNAPPALAVPTVIDIKEHLNRETKALRERGEQIGKMLDKFLSDVSEITSDEEQARAADVVAQIKAHIKITGQRKKTEKQPWIDGGKAIEAFFDALENRLSKVSEIQELQTAYALEVEHRNREAARRAAEEAQRAADELMEAAAKTMSDTDLTLAEQAATEAAHAQELADGRAADLSRVRSDYGVVSSLRRKLVIKVTDKAKVPLEYLIVDETALRQAFNEAKKSGRTLQVPGVEFDYDKSISNRG